MGVRIRGYRPGDLDDLYRICLQTGNQGADATALFRDPDLLGHVYAAPYGLFEPALAFVVEDQAGVGGYCLAALDSRAGSTPSPSLSRANPGFSSGLGLSGAPMKKSAPELAGACLVALRPGSVPHNHIRVLAYYGSATEGTADKVRWRGSDRRVRGLLIGQMITRISADPPQLPRQDNHVIVGRSATWR